MLRHRVISWFLLAILSIQWVGGKSLVRFGTVVWQERQMSEQEQEIAASLFNKLGIDAKVQLLQAQDIEDIHLMGYSSPFLVPYEQANIDQDDQFFVLKTSEDTIRVVLDNVDGTAQDDASALQQSLERYFVDYTFDESPAMPSSVALPHATLTFAAVSWHSTQAGSPLAPPPWCL